MKSVFDDIGIFELAFNPDNKPERDPNIPPIKIKHALDIFVGIPPQDYWLVLFIDGLRVENNAVTPRLKKHDRRFPEQYKDQFCLNIKTGGSEWQLIELEDILSLKTIEFMQEWVEQKKSLLLKIANEYELNERQIYHFMYDLVVYSNQLKNMKNLDRC